MVHVIVLQVTKNILHRKAGGIYLKARRQGSNNKAKWNYPIFSTFVELCAKYRTITFLLIIGPLFPCCLHRAR